MSDKVTLSDAVWVYEIDTAQRAGTTKQTQERRHGPVSTPEPTDGNEPNDQHSEGGEGGFDSDGIPKGI